MAKKGFLSKLGNAVSDGLEKADTAMNKAGDKIAEAGDKIKDMAAGGDSTYITHTLDNMTDVADMLNEAAESGDYKTLKVFGTAQNKDGGVDVLMFVEKK